MSEVCEWRWEKNNDMWKCQCGKYHIFDDYNPDKILKDCPYCRKPIKVVKDDGNVKP